MRITELLLNEGIAMDADVKTKEEAIELMVDLQYQSGNIKNKEEYKKGVQERESQSTTAIGEGIAIPHAKDPSVIKAGLTAITVKNGVDYDAPDGKPVRLIFMIAAPVNDSNVHLGVLSRLSVLLMEPGFKDKLLAAEDKKDFLDIVDEYELNKFGENIEDESEKDKTYRILAVTACPTGIAHTYMAAEGLTKAADDMGIRIKVETNGSGGAKNVLTDDEIEACQGIIIAADKNVDTERFKGKPVLFARVSEGIHRPEELINQVLNNEVDVYEGKSDGESEKEKKNNSGEGIGAGIYRHLMNGVSHMLPFVIGGGILIAIAFLLDDYEINPENFGMNTPAAAFFKTVGNSVFGFMLPVLAAYIAGSIADRPGLAAGFAGGVLAMNGTNFADIADGNVTGVSGGFLAALFAGFVAGYMVKLLKKITAKLPESLDGIRPMLIYPLFGVLLIGVVMCAINPVMGWINTGLGNWLNGMGGSSKLVLGAILGGMMSVDMGGPVNKASYVFGTASIALGNYDVMAAVMVGGMVPPIAIAISTSIFKNKWSSEDRRNGAVNYIMGLCFISEGAIPYAAKDPIRVIPSCVAGSAVAGALSMAFGCTLRAPHGGIFVFPVVGNAIFYIISLVIGSVVGAIILGALKRKINE